MMRIPNQEWAGVADNSDQRLRCERIEAKPKRIIMADNFRDWVGALADPQKARRFNQLIDCVRDGRIVPPNFYRRGIERTPDDLLEEDGIKHLHLDEGGGDDLLFCVEYDDAVVLMETNSHRHFGTEPPGSVLLSLHHECLLHQDREAAERKTMRLRERIRAIKNGLLKRRTSSERR
jgi:hypothetical protein